MAEQRRHLSIGAFPSAIATIVPEALVRMRAAEPELEVNVAATKVDPIEPAVNEELKDWYDRKVRKEIRGRI